MEPIDSSILRQGMKCFTREGFLTLENVGMSQASTSTMMKAMQSRRLLSQYFLAPTTKQLKSSLSIALFFDIIDKYGGL